MENMDRQTGLSADTITDRLIEILEDMTSDWDTGFSGGISAQTMLIADLAFESIDIVQLVVAIEEKFKKRKLPFEKLLMVDGRYVDDLSVGDVARFLETNLQEARQ